MTQTPDRRPRGIRNNNLGNLNFAHQPGAVLKPGPNARFARFPTPEAGLAALRDQLCRYIVRDGIDTVAGIIRFENGQNPYGPLVAQVAVGISSPTGQGASV